MGTADPKVEAYYQSAKKWQAELLHLRMIVLNCDLQETLKWRVPCYTYRGKNVALVSALKGYCALSFPKGALLKDKKKILVMPGENSRAARLIKFTDVSEISNCESDLKRYIQEAKDLEDAGAQVDFSANRELEFPSELQAKFAADKKFEKAFLKLTVGRQRAYVLHFSGAKQSQTRAQRIENYVQRIMDGKGFHDCVCGLSQRMPRCDGSHKDA